MPNIITLTDTQQKLYEKLEAEIKVDQDQFLNSFKEVSDNDLIAFLTAVNTFEKFEDVNQERTETLLAFAISYDRYKAVEAILRATKNLSILEDVLTTTNVNSKFTDDEEHTSIPFVLAISLSTISFNDHQESIKAILHAVKGE
ncbi:MAG: WD_0033/WD_0034 family tandem repeat-containing protein [Wolbachia sp.]